MLTLNYTVLAAQHGRPVLHVPVQAASPGEAIAMVRCIYPQALLSPIATLPPRHTA